MSALFGGHMQEVAILMTGSSANNVIIGQLDAGDIGCY